MKARRFNSIMHFLHENWAAKVLNMEVNQNCGPDIISKNKIMEVKFTLITDINLHHPSWTVLEHQMNYNNGKTGF